MIVSKFSENQRRQNFLVIMIIGLLNARKPVRTRKKQNNLQTVAFKNVSPSDRHLFLSVLYGFPALQVVSLYMGSTCQENPGFDCLVRTDLLRLHRALHSASRRQQYALVDASKFPLCIHGEESATLSPYFPARHALLPRLLGDLLAS
jgi:hypothetical protein